MCLSTDDNDGINSTAKAFVHKLEKGSVVISVEPGQKRVEREIKNYKKIMFLYLKILQAALPFPLFNSVKTRTQGAQMLETMWQSGGSRRN